MGLRGQLTVFWPDTGPEYYDDVESPEVLATNVVQFSIDDERFVVVGVPVCFSAKIEDIEVEAQRIGQKVAEMALLNADESSMGQA